MSDTKISNMTAASTLDGTELVAGVQGGANVKITTLQQKTLSVGAGSVAVASGKTLTASKTLTLDGTDSTVMTFPSTSATIARTDAANTFTGIQTLNTGIAFGAGATFDADYAAVSATGDDTTQTATVSKAVGTITTGALTTGAGASTSVVLTLSGVAAGDPVFLTKSGGTNTSSWDTFSVITTTNTITVSVRNLNLLAALNGTVKFNYFWMKA